MKIENIDIQATMRNAQSLIHSDEQLSAATKSMFEILILIITLLANLLNLNSTNRSKPPAINPNRKRQMRKKTDKKAGGQSGHIGTTLTKIDNPDRIKVIKVIMTCLRGNGLVATFYETIIIDEALKSAILFVA